MEKFVFDLQRFTDIWATGTKYLILDNNNATGIKNVQLIKDGNSIPAGTNNVLRIVVSDSGEVKFTAGSFGNSATVSAAAFKADDKIKAKLTVDENVTANLTFDLSGVEINYVTNDAVGFTNGKLINVGADDMVQVPGGSVVGLGSGSTTTEYRTHTQSRFTCSDGKICLVSGNINISSDKTTTINFVDEKMSDGKTGSITLTKAKGAIASSNYSSRDSCPVPTVSNLPENGEVEFAGDMKMITGVTTTELPEGAVVSVNNKQFAAGPGDSSLNIVQSIGINMPVLLQAGTVKLSDSKTSDVTVYSWEIGSVIGSVRCISGTACVSGTLGENTHVWKLIVIGDGTFETSDAQGKHLETFVISDSGKWATITSDSATFTCEVTELGGKNPEIEFLNNASTELKADDFTWITTRNVSAGKTVELPAVSGTTKHAGDYETVIYHSGADGGYYKDKSNYASFTVSDPQNDPNYRLILNNDVEKVSFTFDMKPLGNKSVKIENVSLGTGSVTYQLKNPVK